MYSIRRDPLTLMYVSPPQSPRTPRTPRPVCFWCTVLTNFATTALGSTVGVAAGLFIYRNYLSS